MKGNHIKVLIYSLSALLYSFIKATISQIFIPQSSKKIRFANIKAGSGKTQSFGFPGNSGNAHFNNKLSETPKIIRVINKPSK